MKLQFIFFFTTLCVLIVAYSNMKQVESECPYFKKHGKDVSCPCAMSKDDLEKCPHLKKMKEAHGDKPGCPYKEAIEGEKTKDCPYLKNHGNEKECPCKKLKKSTGGCPHMKKLNEQKNKDEL